MMKNVMKSVCLIDVWKDENDADDAIYSKKTKIPHALFAVYSSWKCET